jgi:hypothetical protein
MQLILVTTVSFGGAGEFDSTAGSDATFDLWTGT